MTPNEDHLTDLISQKNNSIHDWKQFSFNIDTVLTAVNYTQILLDRKRLYEFHLQFDSFKQVHTKSNHIHLKYTMSNKRSNDALHCSCQSPSLCISFVNLALVCSSVHHHRYCSLMLGCDFVYLKLRRMIIFLIQIYSNFFLSCFPNSLQIDTTYILYIYIQKTLEKIIRNSFLHSFYNYLMIEQ